MTTDEEIMATMLTRSTNPASEVMDNLSVEMFCMLVRSNAHLVHKSQEMILAKIRSHNTTEAINGIKFLRECMSRCGTEFQNEVAKFRFLNDLIRLVSNKYDGACTSKDVRQNLMDVLLLWTTEFPTKTKIREVYDMLMKEIPKEVKAAANSVTTEALNTDKSALGIDEKEFQRLIKSGDPENFKRANLLIQHRVSQESRLTEVNAQHRLILQEVSSTVTVLNQMLDVYESDDVKKEEGSEEMNLMRELYMACKKHKPVMKGLSGMVDTAGKELISDTLEINEQLLAVLKRYKSIVVHNSTTTTTTESNSATAGQSSDHYIEELLGIIPSNLSTKNIMVPQSNKNVPTMDLNELNDIFNSVSVNEEPVVPALQAKTLIPEKVNFITEINKPSVSAAINSRATFGKVTKATNDLRELKGIDALSEQLFKDLTKSKNATSKEEDSSLDDVEILNAEEGITEKSNITTVLETATISDLVQEKDKVLTGEFVVPEKKKQFMKLADINIALEDVVPTAEERVLLDDADIKITLNFTENSPIPQVSVIVISVINKSKLNLEDFIFESSVKKPSKVRLLKPTSYNLTPFRIYPPPTPINQIMLLLNPTEKPVDITCIVGYKLGDDPDLIKESIIANNIPYVK